MMKKCIFRVFWRLFEVVSARRRPRRGPKMGESTSFGTDVIAEVLGNHPL